MAQPAVVGIVGMKALRRDLKHLSDDVTSPLYKAIRAAGKETVEPVAALTRERLPHGTGALAGSVRSSGTRTGGAVRYGSKTRPYAGWVEFGGSRPDGSSREYVATGRYLFPAARDLAGSAAEHYSSALAAVFATSGIWTNETSDGSRVHD
jgi:hypothetical protein